MHIPSWRLDIEREIDIIEELARLHGYDKFANTLPAYSGEVRDLPDAAQRCAAAFILLALGYNEAISLTFISKEDARRFSTAAELDLANPLSDEASVMRTSMVPWMLNMLAYNLNRGSDNVRLFEAGMYLRHRAGWRGRNAAGAEAYLDGRDGECGCGGRARTGSGSGGASAFVLRFERRR